MKKIKYLFLFVMTPGIAWAEDKSSTQEVIDAAKSLIEDRKALEGFMKDSVNKLQKLMQVLIEEMKNACPQVQTALVTEADSGQSAASTQPSSASQPPAPPTNNA